MNSYFNIEDQVNYMQSLLQARGVSMSKANCKEIILNLHGKYAECLKEKEGVILDGVGRLHPYTRKATKRRDVTSKVLYDIPAKNTVKLRISPSFNDLLNEVEEGEEVSEVTTTPLFTA